MTASRDKATASPRKPKAQGEEHRRLLPSEVLESRPDGAPADSDPSLDMPENDLYEKVIKTGVHLKYLTFHELPHYLQDNDCIHTGYRAFYNFRDCFHSVFAIHNETGNIWTHLVGTVFFAALLFYGLYNVPQRASAWDYSIMSIFLLSAIKCLLCSTAFHTFSCHEHRHVYERMAILDYSGISLLIFGSFLIVVNYGLYCNLRLRALYIGLVALVCGSGIVLPWFAFFRRREFRVFRAAYYVAMGLTCGIIALHTAHIMGWSELRRMVAIEYLVLEVSFYLLGAYIYAARIPEVFLPGKLDHFLHSHQLWHVMIVIAAFAHYMAVIGLMNARLTSDTCAVPSL